MVAMLGRYLSHYTDGDRRESILVSSKPIPHQIPWHEVDRETLEALVSARGSAEQVAKSPLDVCVSDKMRRVDEDFLEWYFGYWTQQKLGLRAISWWLAH